DNGVGNDTPAVRWLCGEDLAIGAIRSLKNPPLYNQPDRMSSAFYWCTDVGSAIVHMDSGVGNKAAYLLVDGESFNGYTVSPLSGGMGAVADLFYEVQTNLLTSAGDYQDLYDCLQQAAVNIGLSAADRQELKDACDATEMNQQPTICPAPEAPVCDSGSPVNVFFDNLENTASGNWTHSAAVGSDGWFYPQNSHGVPGMDMTYATSGAYNFWGFEYATQADYSMSMTSSIAIPANAYLRFNHAFEFEIYDAYYCDGGVVEYSTDGGTSWNDAGSLFTHNGYTGALTTESDNPLGGSTAFVGSSNGYISSRLNLSSLAGQNVRFRFRLATDTGGNSYGWFIDDIRIYTCGAAPTPTARPPTPTAAPPTPTPRIATPTPRIATPTPPGAVPTPTAVSTGPGSGYLGDADGNRFVNVADFTVTRNNYYKDYTCIPVETCGGLGDADRNNFVNVADFTVTRNNYYFDYTGLPPYCTTSTACGKAPALAVFAGREAPTMTLNPVAAAVAPGAQQTVAVGVDTAGAAARSAGARLAFDPAILQVVSVVVDSSAWNDQRVEQYSNAEGWINGASPVSFSGNPLITNINDADGNPIFGRPAASGMLTVAGAALGGGYTPGDYNGDGTADIAVYRGSTGLWTVKGVTRVYVESGAIPVPADYDGDRKADIAVFKETMWAVRDVTRVFFGSSGTDLPVPADFNGDGSCDYGVFKTDGQWAVKDITRTYLGTAGDIPVTR
ncbi:MAG: M4 family metallopeptidase, partial [bacterium]|nr:M4 family metallopeptidase [bacterium]